MRRFRRCLRGLPPLSILTAPEGAVQYCRRLRRLRRLQTLSILTAPEGAVQLAMAVSHTRNTISFNPHRPRRSGAIRLLAVVDQRGGLSILTAPEGAVQ